jgi:hypothetical protein
VSARERLRPGRSVASSVLSGERDAARQIRTRKHRKFSQFLAMRIGKFRQLANSTHKNQQLTILARFLLRCWQAQYRASDNTGNKTMTYQAASLRNAFVAVAFTFLASAVFMAGAVGPAIA